VSYARKDLEAVEVLIRDLDFLCGEPTWLDRALPGGQPWWNEILAQIRNSNVVVVALTRRAVRSEACLAELEYAESLDRLIVPVMISDTDLAAAPKAVRERHYVDYRSRTPETTLALGRAFLGYYQRPTFPDPEPLPEPPPMPRSYADSFRALLGQDRLGLDEQAQLFAALKVHTRDEDHRDDAIELLRSLRNRIDLTVAVARELDDFFQAQTLVTAGSQSEWIFGEVESASEKDSDDESHIVPAISPDDELARGFYEPEKFVSPLQTVPGSPSSLEPTIPVTRRPEHSVASDSEPATNASTLDSILKQGDVVGLISRLTADTLAGTLRWEPESGGLHGTYGGESWFVLRRGSNEYTLRIRTPDKDWQLRSGRDDRSSGFLGRLWDIADR
jgi:hypothetical protein